MFACSTRHVILHGNFTRGSWNSNGRVPGYAIHIALYYILLQSTSNNLAANKGCLIQTLNLLVLIRITGIDLAFGVAMH